MQPTSIPIKSRPPYLLGLICLIPLVGAFVGLGLMLYGLLKYKDKWLTIIGAAGILWTVVFYSVMIYATNNISPFNKGWTELSQMQLNSLLKNIEYYKITHGQYPDSLKQLLIDDKLAPIYDPIHGMKKVGEEIFNYEKLGEKYTLFSAGKDGISNTSDDLFPKLTATDSSKIGFIRK